MDISLQDTLNALHITEYRNYKTVRSRIAEAKGVELEEITMGAVYGKLDRAVAHDYAVFRTSVLSPEQIQAGMKPLKEYRLTEEGLHYKPEEELSCAPVLA